MGEELHHFIKKIKYFASSYGIITGFKIKFIRKAVEKKIWAGLNNLICINFKYL